MVQSYLSGCTFTGVVRARLRLATAADWEPRKRASLQRFPNTLESTGSRGHGDGNRSPAGTEIKARSYQPDKTLAWKVGGK